MDVIQAARTAVLRAFRWTDGHADLAGVFRDPETLACLGPALAAPFTEQGITAVVALEARGFAVGALCAQQLGVGLVLARKSGSVHPGDKVEVTSARDWQDRQIAIRLVRILSADKVLLVDDWIETGSQARAAKEAIGECGAAFAGTSVVVDDTTDDVRRELNVVSVVNSTELPDT